MYVRPADHKEFETQMTDAISGIDIQPRLAAAYHADWEYGAFSAIGIYKYRVLEGVDNPFLCMDNKLRWSLLRKTARFLPGGDWTLDITEGPGTIIASIRW